MISARHIVFERNFQPVFRPVDLSVGAGSLLLVTGSNGSGKTTLLRILAGLLTAHEGHLEITSEKTAYLGHRLAVKDDLTVRENLRFTQAFEGGTIAPDQAIDRLGLADCADQPGRSLSAGQRKRCALARLPLTGAPLWLLDEPYSNLDTSGVAILDDLLNEHMANRGACIMSTHGGLRPQQLAFEELELQAVKA